MGVLSLDFFQNPIGQVISIATLVLVDKFEKDFIIKADPKKQETRREDYHQFSFYTVPVY